MRITGVRVVPYRYDLDRRIGDAQMPDGIASMADLAVFLDTDEDLVGVSIGSVAAAEGVTQLAEVLIGSDPYAVGALHERLDRLTFKGGRRGPMGAAVAALDIALWDLRAKFNGQPLWRELGAAEGRVMAYASGLDMPLNDADLFAYYSRMAADYGIGAGKLKVGRDIDRDLERLEIVRDALSPITTSPLLAVDANEYWAPKEAIRSINRLESTFDLAWVEEPIDRYDTHGLAVVGRRIRTAIAIGENFFDVAEYVPLLRAGAADILQVGVTTTGITMAMRIADVADAFGLQVAMMNCPGRFMAHVAAAMPRHTMMEVLDVGRSPCFDSDATLVGGDIVLGDATGIGIVFDEAKLDAHRVHDSVPTLRTVYGRAAGSAALRRPNGNDC